MNRQDQSIVIPQGGVYHFVQLDEIVRMEAQGSYVNFYLVNGKKLLSSKNLGHFKNIIHTGFFISHKSHMINVAHLNSYSKQGILRMSDGSQVPISRRRKEAFMNEVLEQFQPSNREMGVVRRLDIERGGDREGLG